MTPRSYQMGKRAESAAQTRQRIVRATMALHRDRGIAATTMKEIAERADVGIGTVYHHFPRYEDAIRACGARTAELARLPTCEIFDRARSLPARVAVLVAELFAYYDRHPTLPLARCEQDRFPVLGEFVTRRQELIEALVADALRPLAPTAAQVQTGIALTDFAVHRSLLDAGFSTQQAAAQITDVVVRWLSRPRGPTNEPDHAD